MSGPFQADILKVSTDAEILKALANPRTVLLDVRREEEFHTNGLQGSLRITHTEIRNEAHKLPQDKTAPIIAYCASGNRVKTALVTLNELGYTQVLNGTSVSRMAPLLAKHLQSAKIQA